MNFIITLSSPELLLEKDTIINNTATKKQFSSLIKGIKIRDKKQPEAAPARSKKYVE